MRAVVILFAVSLTIPLLTAQGRAAESPTVDQILARYEHAMGGKAQFKKVTSMVFKGTIEFPSNHLSGTTAEYFKSPDHFLTITEVPGYGTLRTVYDGTSAWTEDPKRGVIDISGPALADMRRRADIQWHMKLKEFYPGLKLKGRESIDGKDAWVLEVTEDRWTFTMCFDVASGLMVRFDTDTGEPGAVSRVSIGDYRPVASMQFSYAATMSMARVVWIRKLSDVKFNVPIDAGLFVRTPTEAPKQEG